MSAQHLPECDGYRNPRILDECICEALRAHGHAVLDQAARNVVDLPPEEHLLHEGRVLLPLLVVITAIGRAGVGPSKEQHAYADGFVAGLTWPGDPITCTECGAPVEVVKRGRLMCSADSDHVTRMTRERVSAALRARDLSEAEEADQ